MYRYAVIGAGRQGTAAAYDVAKWGDADRIILADADYPTAQAAADRINAGSGKPSVEPAQLDIADRDAAIKVLSGTDVILSAVPYYYNLELTDIAIELGAHMCDLGGHTGIARQQHEKSTAAIAAGISIVPNCGQVPGMGTSMVVYTMGLLDRAVDVYMWDGGIPQRPLAPFDYLLTFHVAGLTNEYA